MEITVEFGNIVLLALLSGLYRRDVIAMWRILAVALLGGAMLIGRAEQTPQSFERTISRTVGYRYLLSLPDGFQQGSGKKWPVILFLHGSGECGDDLSLVTRQGIPRLLSGDKNLRSDREREAAKLLHESFIVVSPQCAANGDWDADAVLALLDEILAHRDGDPTRVYLTGLSLGGFATWTIGLRHPSGLRRSFRSAAAARSMTCTRRTGSPAWPFGPFMAPRMVLWRRKSLNG